MTSSSVPASSSALSPLWSASEAVLATGGQATADFTVTGVSIDTRSLQKGDMFVALAAARDGHDFVAAALEKGAACALVSRRPEGVAEDAPLLIVKDVLAALEDLGRAARARTQARVIAVTGSAGKTSTKEMLRAALGQQGRVHAAEASYNNHWGVPLTLARMPRETEIAIIEIGMNHPGEIAPLARLARPHAAIITTVAAAHLEAFAAVSDIAVEKAAIIEGLEPDGFVVLPADLDVTPVLTQIASLAGVPSVMFGTSAQADYQMIDMQVSQGITVARARSEAGAFVFRLHTLGRHFAMNGLAVVAVAERLGFDRAITLADLGRWQPPAGRGRLERIVVDALEERHFGLIDDAFNANPASMAAALDLLAASEPIDQMGRLARGRRVAVLGDMLELGPREAELHAEIATYPVMDAVTLVHCVGERMRALYEALPSEKRGFYARTPQELLAQVRLLADPGDIILVKGSKGSKVSLVVDALRELGQAAR